jgi:hypothetical protein
MTKHLIILAILALCLAGCHRGDLKVEPAIKGQPAAITGWNIGPELYIEQGQPCPITGAIVYIKGLDPNELVND